MSAPWSSRVVQINGLDTHYLEAGTGEPLVLLHGGEFGASAELAWEHVIAHLAEHRRVVAPDILGFGRSAKVVDFVDGRGWRLQHIAALCRHVGIERADFVGNSMGGAMLLADAAASRRQLPMRSLVSACGGGEIAENEHMAALMDFDATHEGMRRIVAAMFADENYASDEALVRRRLDSALQPGAWEAVASARFRRPGHRSQGSSQLDYSRADLPALIIEGELDKLKPTGWAHRLASQLPRATAVVVGGAGHCPQIERPAEFAEIILNHLDPKENGS